MKIKVPTVIILLTTLLALAVACSNGATYTEAEYNSVVAERDRLQQELNAATSFSAEPDLAYTEAEYNSVVAERDALQQELDAASSSLDELLHEIAEPVVNAGNAEIERKFLLDLDNLPQNLMANGAIYEFEQSYISHSPEIRIRSVNQRTYYFVMKTPLDETGLSRQEVEFRITKEEYDELFPRHIGKTIYKTRYQFYVDDFYVAVDVYSGDLDGLAVAEVEFESVEAAEAFQPPEWFGEDVTADKRYKNANLAIDGLPKEE
ncbi:MAG: CYTH domain-containing protein [Oscillospiraceae bacterium]|nr:CYTH domain-containing protein [Oscillospiraceae bacterium]